jgi:hypothetical protein
LENIPFTSKVGSENVTLSTKTNTCGHGMPCPYKINYSGFCGGNSPGNSNAFKHGLNIHHKRIRNTNPIEKAGTAPLPYLAYASSSRPSAAGARASLLCDNEFVSIEKEEIY